MEGMYLDSETYDIKDTPIKKRTTSDTINVPKIKLAQPRKKKKKPQSIHFFDDNIIVNIITRVNYNINYIATWG